MSELVVAVSNAAGLPPFEPAPSAGVSSIGRGITASIAAHALLAAGAIAAGRGHARPIAAPVYRVTLVAAPAGSTAPAPGRLGSAVRPSEPHAPAASRAPAPTARSAPVTHSALAASTAAAPVAHAHTAARAGVHTTPPASPAALAPTPVHPVHTPVHTSSPVHAPPRPAPSVAHPTPTVRPPTVPSPEHPTTHATAAPARRTGAKTPTPARTGVAPTGAAPTGAAPTAPVAAPATAHVAATAAGGTAPAGRGHDVADVRVVGLEFPVPGYLDNLVRQVRLRFAPTQAHAGLHADLAFVVARDGSISGLRVARSSGSYAFDLEAQGAVEAAGSARAFGPLPDGFHAPTLPVTFSFDPRSAP